MRKKWAVLVVLAVGLSIVTAVPAVANRPLVGSMDLDFNLGFGDAAAPCPDVTWAGNIDFDGDVHGMAFVPTAPPEIVGRAFHFEESWMVYAQPFAFTGGVLSECDDGNPVVLSGYDAGVESMASLIAVANGAVEWVDPDGPFDEALADRHVHWSGLVEANLVEFSGTWRVR